MRKAIHKTPRKGIFVCYYETHKKGKKVITAQLTDEYGMPIDGCSASYTMQSRDTDDDARIAARGKALKKFEAIFTKSFTNDEDDKENFFSKRWLDIPENSRVDFAPATRKNKNSKQTAITYFESNVIPLLDTYGPSITEDQCRAISTMLYNNTLLKKKYTHCYISKETAVTINAFISIAKSFFTSDNLVKKALGSFPSQKNVELLMDIVQTAVLTEDRLRSLLEFSLTSEEKLDDFVSKCLWTKILDDGILITQFKKLNVEKNRSSVADKLIFFLRELSGNEAQTKIQTNTHIRDANEILANLCRNSPRKLPTILLPEFIVNRVPQIEACKELPWKVRVRFSAICMHIAAEDPYAVGGIIMMTSGPRVDEVCAIQYGDILDCEDWGVCVINYTADGNIRVGEGKNIYFHRPIFFPKFAMDAIHRRKNNLLSMGYSAEELKSAYITPRTDDLFLPANPHAFSARIKKLLRIAGCADEYWESVRYAMNVEPDLDYFHRPEKFDIAYGLRRDATTMACNIARINPLKVDAFLGHRLPRNSEDWNNKITREDEWRVIVGELERIVYDPDHSNHPLFAPVDAIKLIDNDKTAAREELAYHGISIKAEESIQFTAKVITIGNSDIRYSIPESSKQRAAIESITNTSGPAKWLGMLHSKEEYDRVKSQAIDDYLKEGTDREFT